MFPTVSMLTLNVFLGVAWPWLAGRGVESIVTRVEPPHGFERIPAREGSFAAWMRGLPLRPGRPDVFLHDGTAKGNQDAHYAVFDIDVGSKDLQQCADAVIRLRAEYLFSTPCREDIRFNFTSGDTARWSDWSCGFRPEVRGSEVSWYRTEESDDSYHGFRNYLDAVFTYAGSASLSRELLPVSDPSKPEIGDVYIQGGFPGHAVIVVDVAEDGEGNRVFLLVQSYMPAQDIHILRSFDTSINPWYRARSHGVLKTPEWEFQHQDLKRFRMSQCVEKFEQDAGR